MYSNPSPVGQRPNGPAGLTSQTGVLCHLPNAAVLYPFRLRSSAIPAALFAQTELYPGKPAASSGMRPNPTWWLLRPDSSAVLVGAHLGVT